MFVGSRTECICAFNFLLRTLAISHKNAGKSGQNIKDLLSADFMQIISLHFRHPLSCRQMYHTKHTLRTHAEEFLCLQLQTVGCHFFSQLISLPDLLSYIVRTLVFSNELQRGTRKQRKRRKQLLGDLKEREGADI
jgi:hypothetical protein